MHFIIFGNFSGVISLNIVSSLYYLLIILTLLIGYAKHSPFVPQYLLNSLLIFLSLYSFLIQTYLSSNPFFNHVSSLLFHLFLSVSKIQFIFNFYTLTKSACSYFKYYLLNIFSVVFLVSGMSQNVLCNLLSVSPCMLICFLPVA